MDAVAPRKRGEGGQHGGSLGDEQAREEIDERLGAHGALELRENVRQGQKIDSKVCGGAVDPVEGEDAVELRDAAGAEYCFCVETQDRCRLLRAILRDSNIDSNLGSGFRFSTKKFPTPCLPALQGWVASETLSRLQR